MTKISPFRPCVSKWRTRYNTKPFDPVEDQVVEVGNTIWLQGMPLKIVEKIESKELGEYFKFYGRNPDEPYYDTAAGIYNMLKREYNKIPLKA